MPCRRTAGWTVAAVALGMAVSGGPATSASPASDDTRAAPNDRRAPSAAPAGSRRPAAPSRTAVRRALRNVLGTGVPGAVVRIVKPRGTETYTSGLASLQPRRRIRAGDRYRAGSVTKLFTAARAMQLVEAGSLALTDTVEQRLPGLLAGGEAITLAHLLSHTSGLADYTREPAFLAALARDPLRHWAPRELVAIAAAAPRRFAPGEGFAYSDTNTVLAGLMIEATTGRTAAEELRAGIFEPLEMSRTALATGRGIRRPFAAGHELSLRLGVRPVAVTNAVSPTIASTAGAAVSTAADVDRFAAALLGGRLLRAQTLAQMLTPVSEISGSQGGHIFRRVGLGVFEARLPCGTMWGQDGEFPGYKGIVLSSRDGRRRVVVWINASQLDDEARELNRRLWRTAACRALLA